jgi:DNA helicase II / ATP-dependent DNA helicase PcrA
MASGPERAAAHAAAACQPPLDGLNPEQRVAVEAVRGPVVILAGAGTGKTRTITHRIAHQVASGVAAPSEVLAVTFTERAAHELQTRLRALGLPRPVRAATFHAAAWAQLRHFWSQLSDRPLPSVLPSKLRLLVPLARSLRVEATDLAAEIEWAKARGLPPERYAEHATDRDPPVPARQMAELYERYERDKADRDLIDYEDMLLRAAQALRSVPEVADAVRERYRVFTVDEFQDVNPAQWALLDGWLGERRDVCVVGDDDQTIYRFTGATESYLTGFARRFPDATTVRLVRNYRSTPQVLALANRVLAAKPAELRKTLTPTRADGPRPALREFPHGTAEVAAVVARVRELLAAGVAAAEIAVLYRVNSQSEPFEEAFADAGVPHLVRGDGGFFQRPEIRQALDALGAAAADPPPPERAPPPVGGSRPAEGPRADRLAERVLRERLSWHPRREPSGERARERWRNLGALLELVGRLVDEAPGRGLGELVADLRGRAAAGHDSPHDGQAVVLSTIHKAKGLEFDAVFVVAVEEGLLPISYARSDAELWDERRLFYVAVTRAREHLWISWATQRTGRRGRDVPRRPSRLLAGLGAAAPASGAARGRRAAARAARPAATSADPALEERLRAWRRDRARRDGVPAYVVFPDAALSALAAAPPTSPEQLLGVHGFGPARVERYGAEVLAVLREPR